MIEIIISLLCFVISIVVIITSLSGLYYVGNKNSKEFQCIMLDERKSVVGRLNDKGDSECIYNPDSVGCYIVSHLDKYGELISKEKSDELCKKIIENYPKIEINGKTIEGDIYTCGKNSTNEKLWNNTGYENKKDTCYKIREERSILNEIKKWLKKI